MTKAKPLKSRSFQPALSAKATEHRTLTIYAGWMMGRTQKDLGEEFGISKSRVSMIFQKHNRKVGRLAWRYSEEGRGWHAGRMAEIKKDEENAEREKRMRLTLPYLTPLHEIEGLSARARNCLRDSDLLTVGQIDRATDAELLRLPNFGRRSLREVREVIETLLQSEQADSHVRRYYSYRCLQHAFGDKDPREITLHDATSLLYDVPKNVPHRLWTAPLTDINLEKASDDLSALRTQEAVAFILSSQQPMQHVHDYRRYWKNWEQWLRVCDRVKMIDGRYNVDVPPLIHYVDQWEIRRASAARRADAQEITKTWVRLSKIFQD